MKIEIYAVICGVVRNELEFDSVLNRLIELRKEGAIKGILLSTWDNEFENRGALKKKILDSNVEIIESQPIDEGVKNSANIGYYRQAKQLESALSIIPDESFVLKCRTDMSCSELNEFFITFDPDGLIIKERNVFNIDLKYKINVMRLGFSHIFGLDDLLFLGHKMDLYKMVNYDCVKLHYNLDMSADCYFFLAPFINRFDFLRDYYSKFFFMNFRDMIMHIGREKTNVKQIPKLIVKIYSFYFLLLDSCFIHYDRKYKNVTSIVSIDDIFYKNDSVFTILWWWKVIIDSRIIADIIKNNVVKSDISLHFHDELLKMSDSDYVRNLRIEDFEIEDLVKWMKTNGVVKNNLLRPIDKRTIRCDDCIDDHYYHFELEDAYKEKYEISLKKINSSISYYSTLENHLKILCMDKRIKIMALSAMATVVKNCNATIDLSRELDNISDDLAIVALHPFKRLPERMYAFPSKKYRIIANYYYCRSTKDCHYEIQFLRAFSKYYQIKTVATTVDELVDEIIIGLLNNNKKLWTEEIFSLISFILTTGELELITTINPSLKTVMNIPNEKVHSEIQKTNRPIIEKEMGIEWKTERKDAEKQYGLSDNFGDYLMWLLEIQRIDKITKIIESSNDINNSTINAFKGILYHRGILLSKDLNRSYLLLKKAVHEGEHWALIDLIDVLAEINSNESLTERYEILRGISVNTVYKCVKLAESFLSGKGVKKSEDDATKWYMRAANINPLETYKEMVKLPKKEWTQKYTDCVKTIRNVLFIDTVGDSGNSDC